MFDDMCMLFDRICAFILHASFLLGLIMDDYIESIGMGCGM